MGRGNLLNLSITDRSKCSASKLMKTTWDHNSDTWKYCRVTWRCVRTDVSVEPPAPSSIPSMVAGSCKNRFLTYTTHQYRRQ